MAAVGQEPPEIVALRFKCQRSVAPRENKIKEKSEGYYGVKVKGVPECVSARQTLPRGE